MTKLLKQAFSKASKLPLIEQNLFARWLLEEMASEKRWDASFAKSEDLLSELAREAITEHKHGKTKLLSRSRL